MLEIQTGSSWSNSFFAIKRRTLTFLLATLVFTLLTPLNPVNATGPGDLDKAFATTGSINVNDLFDRYVNVERIAADDEDRIVVLASFSDGVNDNHILFRLNQNGTYDNQFGDSGFSLNNRNYILVAQTSLNFTYERVDLEIDSKNRLLVLIFGASDFGYNFEYQSFVKRFLDTGVDDPDFGVEGTIDFFSGSEGPPLFLTDLSLDGPSNGDGFLVAGFDFYFAPNTFGYAQLGLQIKKFDDDGKVVTTFGNEEDGLTVIDTEFIFGLSDLYQNNGQNAFINDVRIAPDYADGYIVAYFGLIREAEGPPVPATGIVRLLPSGFVDEYFAAVPENYFGIDNAFVQVDARSNHLLFFGFTFTDIVPDGLDSVGGNEGFLISGTGGFIFNNSDSLSLLLRLKTDGTFDPSYKHSALINGKIYDLTDQNFDPDISLTFSCYNQALFRNIDPNESSTAIIVADSCGSNNDIIGTSALLGYLKSGALDTNFGDGGAAGFTSEEANNFTNVITQIEQTKNGKILVLRGAEPTTGFLGFYWRAMQAFSPSNAPLESEVTISSYRLRTPVTFTLSRDSETATVGVAVTGYTVAVAGNIEAGVGDVEATYSISPALGNGLTFDTSTARISGVPTSPLARQTFTVTGVFETFSPAFVYRDTSTATFTLTINAVPAQTPPAQTPPAQTPPAQTPPAPPVVVYVAPTPVPYLKTLTTPKLRLSSGKLLCTPGTYNAGYTLDGVIQGSTTTLFTPSSFTYNLLINGITQTSLAVTSSSTSHSWNMPASTSGALITCSVTVTANGITNTDKSGDNTSGASSALTTQSAAIATANATYSAALSANTKAYQKALVDNRTQWRSTTEKIRTDYYAERNRISSLPSTKATRALSSAALKAYTAAVKKSAADYKASGPAALAAKDVADKAALDAKSAALAKANAAYGTAIESIGYGVLIP